jgi:hypothetical protein
MLARSGPCCQAHLVVVYAQLHHLMTAPRLLNATHHPGRCPTPAYLDGGVYGPTDNKQQAASRSTAYAHTARHKLCNRSPPDVRHRHTHPAWCRQAGQCAHWRVSAAFASNSAQCGAWGLQQHTLVRTASIPLTLSPQRALFT